MNYVFIATSLDGYIADKNGSLDWLHKTVAIPEGMDMGFSALMQKVDALVMGRNTFDVVCGFGGEWPYPIPVFVWSKTLTELPEAYAGKAFLVKGSAHQIIEQTHAHGFNKLYVDGGKTIQSFLQQGLIDELVLTTLPVLLGGGAPLFGDLEKPLNLELIKSEVFLEQIVQSTYRVKRYPEAI